MTAETVEFRPTREQYAWTFGGAQPILTVDPGTRMRLWTDDAYSGAIRTVGDRVSQLCTPGRFNPQTGPFHVRGARPGDTLVIHVMDLIPARDFGCSALSPLFGGLTSTLRSPTLQAPLDERVWVYDVDRPSGTLRFTAGDSEYSVDLPCEPMLGTIGVAPAHGEVRSSMVPDYYGGNLDSPLIRAGATCYFGVNVDGAAFSIGDGHYRQGEGELCGSAVEGAMDVDLLVDLIPGVYTPWPRVETDTSIAVLGSGRPLEEAWRVAHHSMAHWISTERGLSLMDSYQLLSQIGRSPLANVVDPNFTATALVDKGYLPAPVGVRDVHADMVVRARNARAHGGP